MIYLLSALRPINPNVDQIKNIYPFYVTINETQQIHLNLYFSGYNLRYSVLDSTCDPKIDITEGLRLMNNLNSSLNSQNLFWSFYIDRSHLKTKIIALDLSSNNIYTSNIDISKSLDEFNLLFNLQMTNSSCKSFITLNTSIICVLCVDKKNNSEFLIMYDLEKSSHLVGGPFYLSQTLNNSHIKLFISEIDTYLLIRYWFYGETQNNQSQIEVYQYNLTSKNIQMIKTITKNTFRIDTLAILDLKLYNNEIIFTELQSIAIRFNFTANLEVLFTLTRTEIPMNKIQIFKFGLFPNFNLYMALASSVGFIIIVNWTDENNPLLLEKYSIPQVYGEIKYLNFNEKYLIYYAGRDNMTNFLFIYERGKKILNHLYLAVSFNVSENTLIEFITENDNLIIFSNNSLNNYLLYHPILKIDATYLNYSVVSKMCNFTLMIISSDPQLTDKTIKNITFDVKILNASDTNLYSIMLDSKPYSYIDYPGQSEFSIDHFYMGPDIYYTISLIKNDTARTNEFFEKSPANLLINSEYHKEFALDLKNKEKFFKNKEEKLYDSKNQENLFFSENKREILFDSTNDKAQEPLLKINKINKLIMDFSFLTIDPSTIIFQYMYCYIQNTSSLIWFIQVSNYTLYVLECEAKNVEKSPICQIKGNISNLNSVIVNLSLAYQDNKIWFVIKMSSNLFDIQFYDFYQMKQLNITLPIYNDILSQVFDFTIINFKIVLVQSLSKIILIIDLNSPDKILFTIDGDLMKTHNFQFFSPMRVQSQFYHKDILFILDKVCLIIIDISNIYGGDIIVIKSIESEATRKFGNSLFSLSISQFTLVILSAEPQLIEEYSLSNYYLIYMRKRYPLYNYTIALNQESFDFNQVSGFFFIHANDENQNAVILVYNSDTLAHNVLYATIPLNTKFPQIYVQSSGINSIYLAIVNNTNIVFYQVYQNSTLIMNSLGLSVSNFYNKEAFLFNLSIQNSFSSDIYNVTYNVTTWDSGVNITVNDIKSDLPNKLIRLKKGSNNTIDFCPYSLFNGSVISYSIECDNDCGKSIHLMSPLNFTREILPENSYYDMILLNNGFLIQTIDKLMFYNQEFQLTDTVQFYDIICKKTAYYAKSNLTISACKKPNQNYVLYIMDSSLNPNTYNITLTLNNIVEMQVFKDFLIILNAPEDQNNLFLFESSIFVFNFDNNKLFFMDTIDSDDVELDHLYISGLDISEADDNETIRFFLIDPYNCLLIVDFNVSDKYQQIKYSLNLIDFIENDGVDQKILFSAVKIVDMQKNLNISNFTFYSLIVSTTNFHSYELLLQIKKQYHNNSDIWVKILRCYFRYGFYFALNKIFANKNDSWFFIIPYLLPSDLMINYNDFSKQIFILFDRRDAKKFSLADLKLNTIETLKGQSYDHRLLLGGYSIDSLSIDYFAKILGRPVLNDIFYTLVYKNPLNQTIEELLIRANISIIFDKSWSNDSFLKLTAKNDYNQFNLSLKINIEKIDDSNENKIWIIGLVIALLIVAVILIFVVKKYGKKGEEEFEENEEDLMEEEEEN